MKLEGRESVISPTYYNRKQSPQQRNYFLPSFHPPDTSQAIYKGQNWATDLGEHGLTMTKFTV